MVRTVLLVLLILLILGAFPVYSWGGIYPVGGVGLLVIVLVVLLLAGQGP